MDKEDLKFQQKHYLHNINGQIFTNHDMITVQKLIHNVAENVNYHEYIIIGANTVGITLMFAMMKQNTQLLLSFTLILFVFCIVSIALSLIMRWDINIKRYAIHLISGATIPQIIWYTFVEIACLVSLSLATVFLFMQLIGEMPIVYYFIMCATSICIVILSMFPFCLKLKRVNIAEILKKME